MEISDSSIRNLIRIQRVVFFMVFFVHTFRTVRSHVLRRCMDLGPTQLLTYNAMSSSAGTRDQQGRFSREGGTILGITITARVMVRW